MGNNLEGNLETHVLESSEADLDKQSNDCKKDHKNFEPADTFKVEHLPEGHRDEDLYKYIKAVADLTVRIIVKMTSPHRPEFWPNTKNSYPRDPTKFKIGSGTMSGVNKFTNGYRDDLNGDKYEKNNSTCWCKQCQHSDTANEVRWEFDVFTAAHVVFDDIEASHTSLKLFYDKEDSPVVMVDQVSVSDVSIEKDRCRLKCVTCDKNLGDKLKKLWIHYDDAWRKVLNKYKQSRDVDKLNFIVSHPHGRIKQVSVGRWMKKYKTGELTRFTYTTCPCPGSSGAKVNCVGYEGDGLMYKLVHIGRSKSKHNISGAGVVW